MLTDPAAMLRHLFAIPPDQIDRDVQGGERNLERIFKEIQVSLEGRDRDEDPEGAAQYHHKRMVTVKVLREREKLEEAFTLFSAAMAAHHVAEEAVAVAHEHGRLAELGHRMRAIEVREGLQDDEFWGTGEGPEDYQALTKESEELYHKVRDTVFTTVLRRYHLGEIADLYENDRPRYDRLWERGRQMVFERRPEE